MLREISFLLLLACPALAWSQTDAKAPEGFDIPADTLSPDERYGVTVPLLADHPFTGNKKQDRKWDSLRNSLLEVRTGRVLAVIQSGTVGWDRMGHDEILPTHWSPEGSIAIWQISGKWSDAALVVLKLQNGKVAWQANVLKLGEQAILDRTKQAAPKKYAKVRKTNVGMGGMAADQVAGVDDPRSAYPEGFSIQVDVVGPVTFPLHVTAELTSEAKPGVEMYNFLTSHLTGLLNANGRLTVTSFRLGPGHPSHFSEE